MDFPTFAQLDAHLTPSELAQLDTAAAGGAALWWKG